LARAKVRTEIRYQPDGRARIRQRRRRQLRRCRKHAFVVDVWNKTDDHYALSVRYLSAASGAPQTQPENPAK